MRIAVFLLLVASGVPAARGDVVTAVSGTTLFVTGDASPEAVRIEPAPGGIVVLGEDGTLVDGSALGVLLSGVNRLRVRLHEGADRLTLTAVTFSNGIGLRLGGGNDSVVLDGVEGGATRIRTDGGWDAVGVYGWSRYRHLSILTARGLDWVDVEGVWVPGNLYVDTGSDDDTVTIAAAQIDGDADVYLGSDEDVLVLADVQVDDDTDIDGNDGDNWLYLYGYIWFDEDVDIDGFGDWWW